MSSVIHDITIEQGSKFVFYVGYDDSDGALVDLSGATAQMQVRMARGSEDALLDLATGTGIELGTFTFANETFNIKVTVLATAASAIPDGLWVYDLEVSPGGVVDDTVRVIEGTVRVKPEVTR